MSNNLNRFSKTIMQDLSLGAARAMLYGAGYNTIDFNKAQVAVGTMFYEINPCNKHLLNYAEIVRNSVNSHPHMKGTIFNTIGVSDGISMGTQGMRYSLPSRELIADSIEMVMRSMYYDSNISITSCDKNTPGALIGLSRVNRPSMIIYGGSIMPGKYRDKDVDVVTAFQSYGEMLDNKISHDERENLLKCCCPGSGSCGGMYTANTMAIATEAMGFSLPYSSSYMANSKEKFAECRMAFLYLYNLIKNNTKPSDIITYQSLKNAIVTIITLGGSTNAVLHLLALAETLKIPLKIEDFNTIGQNIPIIANMKPFGDYLMNDISENGGLPLITKYLLEEGLIDGNCLTVTGRTIRENFEKEVYVNTSELRSGLNEKLRKLYHIQNPIKNNTHICIFKGNFCENAVGKITGKEGKYFKGICVVFNNEDEFQKALENNEIKEGMAIIIRYQGPKGAPGMPEMLKSTSLIAGYGLNGKVAFLSDGRFSGGSHGFVIGHIHPEAYEIGPIALVENGDSITIDADDLTITLDVSNDEMENRKKKYIKPSNKEEWLDGYLQKFRKLVKGADKGCITF